MRRNIVKSILLFLLISLCACGKKDNQNDIRKKEDTVKTADIVVVCSDWNGWDAYYEPVEVTEEYTVEEGDTINLDKYSMSDDFNFKIVSIKDKSIIIETNQSMSGSEVDYPYIDLSSDETFFVVLKGEKIKLVTPSTDCGDIYIIEYK